MRPGFVVPLILFIVWLPVRASGQDRVPSPLSVEEAIRIADARNPSIAEARAGVAVAGADRLDARLRPNPALSVESANNPVGGPRSSIWNSQEFSLRLDQELETSGRRGLRIGIAQSGADAAEQGLENARRLLALQVRRGYLDIVLALADFDTASKSLTEVDQLIALNRARFEQGEIAGVEVRRLQVERLRFSDDVYAADLAVRRARSSLLALLGYQDLGQKFEITLQLAVPSGPYASLGAPGGSGVPGLQARALTLRQDVKSALAEQSRADTQTRLQRALRTPNVTFGGGYVRDFGTNALSFGVTIPLPLANRNQGGIARSEAEREIASSRRQAVETLVRLEVQQAADALEVAASRAKSIEQDYLPNAREAHAAVLASYRVGAANLIDLLDAQRALRDTQRTFNRALFDWHVSVAHLAAAIGEPSISR